MSATSGEWCTVRVHKPTTVHRDQSTSLHRNPVHFTPLLLGPIFTQCTSVGTQIFSTGAPRFAYN